MQSQGRREHRPGEVRGAFYAGSPVDLIKFSEQLRNSLRGRISISEVRSRDDGDYQILVTVFLREAVQP